MKKYLLSTTVYNSINDVYKYSAIQHPRTLLNSGPQHKTRAEGTKAIFAPEPLQENFWIQTLGFGSGSVV